VVVRFENRYDIRNLPLTRNELKRGGRGRAQEGHGRHSGLIMRNLREVSVAACW
jgi:hypothetical protein